MNIRTNLICICAVALLAGPAVVSSLRAQSDQPQPRVENRLLLIFDTSSAMKKRVPAEQKAINQLFEITLNGHLHAGDSVGVWTFNRDLRLGQFPQQEWTDDKASALPPEIGGFLKKQHYTKETRFDDLIRMLNQVVQTSPRLTTLIFCDGDGVVSGIPGADAINATFKAHQRQMEKAHVPYVIVLRSQFDRNQVGQYVGCTINSADSITLPQFPPMWIPPQPIPVKAPAPPPPPMAPPLIVIGTNSGTNLPPPKAPPAAPPQPQSAPTLPPPARPATPAVPVPPAASPPPTVPLTQTNSMAQTNSVPPPAAVIQPEDQTTNTPSQATAQPVPPPTDVSIPPAAVHASLPPENAGMSGNRLLAAGVGLFIGAVAIVFLILRRSRGNGSTSLITESLKKR